MNARISSGLINFLLLFEAPLLFADEPKQLVDRDGDPLPRHAIARLGTTRFRQAGMEREVLYHPSGKSLATIGYDRSVILWDPDTGKRQRGLATHTSFIRGAVFSRDGKYVASGDYEHRILVCEFATGKVIQNFQSSFAAHHLDFSADGRYLACGGTSGSFQVWDLKTGGLAHEDSISNGYAHSLEFTSDSKLLAIGGTNNKILLLNTDGWRTEKTLVGNSYRLRLSPDGRRLLTLSDKTLSCWDLSIGKLAHELDPGGSAYNFAIHPNGKLAATGSSKGHFRVWDLEAGKLLKECKTPQLYVFGLAFSPDGSKLATSDSSLEIWDTTKWERLSKFEGPSDSVNLVAFADNGSNLVSLNNHSPHFQIRHWDVVTMKEVTHAERHDGGLMRFAFSRDGKSLFGYQWQQNKPDSNISIWEPKTAKERVVLSAPYFVGDYSVAPENDQLVGLVGQDDFVIWDVATGVKKRSFKRTPSDADRKDSDPFDARGRSASAYSMSLSSGGNWLAAAEGEYFDNSITVWNASAGVREQTFGGKKSGGRQLAFFSVGSSLADGLSIGSDVSNPTASTIEVWEPYTGKSRRRFPDVAEPLRTMAVSPDGKRIASGYPSGIVRIWDLATEKLLVQFEGHLGPITCLVFSADGTALASGSADTTILVWRLPAFVKPTGSLSDERLEQCWKDLGCASGHSAYSAILDLAENPTQSLPFLERKLAGEVKPEDVQLLLAGLDDKSYRVRERAFQELAGMGNRVRPSVEKLLKSTKSAEVQQRCEKLLKQLRVDVRFERAFESLRLIGVPEAQILIKRFQQG